MTTGGAEDLPEGAVAERVADRAEVPALQKKITRALAVALSIFQLWAILFGTMDPLLHRALFLSAILCLAFLTLDETHAGRGGWRRVWPLVAAGATFAAGAYFLLRFSGIQVRWPIADPLAAPDLLVGLVFLAAVIELTRRVIGPALWGVILVFLAYALAGHLADGIFYHRPLSLPVVVDHLVFTINGLFSSPIAVAATYVYLFVLFGTALELSGGGDFFFRIANSLAGRGRGAPAKVAVVASALFGTINGSPSSNVVTTGAFTIPLMKRMGFSSVSAGAIEAVAATGGALLPPVMGTAVFLMVEFTGIPYVQIAIAGLVPALLYYFGIFMQVHWRAAKMGLQPEEGTKESAISVLRSHGQHIVPLAVLVGLMGLGYTPVIAAGVATALSIAVSWLRPETRMGPRQLVTLLDLSAQRSVVVGVACAAAGIVVGGISMTGLGGKFGSLLFAFAGGSLVLALGITAVVCVIFGMGMPVPSAYVLTAVLAGPPLLLLGLPEMGAHLFIVYYSVLSAITPPVAVAAYAAAGIAQADPTRVGLEAVRLGLVAFILPFFFVYRPELLLQGTVPGVIWAIVGSTAGVFLLTGGLEGFMRTRLGWGERAALLAGGFLLIYPGLVTDTAGMVLGVIGLRRQVFPVAHAYLAPIEVAKR